MHLVIGKSSTPVEYLLAKPGSFGGLRPYSQNFIFFATLELAQKDRALHYTRLERFARDKHSSILGLIISYEENEV